MSLLPSSCCGNSSEEVLVDMNHRHSLTLSLSSSRSNNNREHLVTATSALIVAAVAACSISISDAFTFSCHRQRSSSRPLLMSASPTYLHRRTSNNALLMDDERQQRSSSGGGSTTLTSSTAFSSSVTLRSFSTSMDQSSFLEAAVRNTVNNNPFFLELEKSPPSTDAFASFEASTPFLSQPSLTSSTATHEVAAASADHNYHFTNTDEVSSKTGKFIPSSSIHIDDHVGDANNNASADMAPAVLADSSHTWTDQLLSLGSNDTKERKGVITTTTKIRASVKETGAESISYYLKTMGNHELLQASEEVILAREIQKLCQYEDMRTTLEYELLRPPTYAEWANRINPNLTVQGLKRQIRRSQRAKAALTESNLRLVISIARRYVNRGLNFQDLCQEGIFGLTKACEKFDPELGFRFSTYSTWWIKQGIMRAIADQGRTIRLPVHIHDQLNSIRKTEAELQDELGRAASSVEIGNKLGISEQRVEFIKKKGANSVSMEAPVMGGAAKGSKAGGGSAMDKETTVQDMVGDPAQIPMDEAFNQMFRDDMSRLISTLNSREQAVVRMRFGLDDGKAKTLEEIGRRFSVTRERIRQIEARALHKLRQPYRNYSVKCYVNDL